MVFVNASMWNHYFWRATNPFLMSSSFLLGYQRKTTYTGGNNSAEYPGCKLRTWVTDSVRLFFFFFWWSCPVPGAKTHYAFTLLNTCVHFMQPMPILSLRSHYHCSLTALWSVYFCSNIHCKFQFNFRLNWQYQQRNLQLIAPLKFVFFKGIFSFTCVLVYFF